MNQNNVNTQQLRIALAKLYSGTVPGDDMWCELDYEAVEYALGHPVERRAERQGVPASGKPSKYEALKTERDALAAHVERLTDLWREMHREEDDERAAVLADWFDTALEGVKPTASLTELKTERDALAAHVERWSRAWEARREFGIESYLEDVYDDQPTESLAHLKTYWQAEALDEQAKWILRACGGGFLSAEEVHAILTKSAGEIRRQAEEMKP